MARVEELGTHGATGVLEVTGDPSGVIYLDEGRVAFARASWTPGFADRVRGQAPAELGDLLADPRTDDAAIAAHLVRRGYLTAEGLHELIRSVVVDAFLVLAVPLVVNSHIAAMRFVSTRPYWTELFPRLDVSAVYLDAIKRAERMSDYGLAPTTAVTLCDLRLPAAVLTQRQWAVACQIRGQMSARDLALRNGTALADTAECLGSLIWANLCVPVRAAKRRELPSGRPERVQSPQVEVLQQVLNGLRNLS